ncbi:MAG: DUF3467 domain-containing protein [Bacteroidales bacterium]|nr:DUF3467 domain-containing protein [Bacteroidales bacterium]
MANEQEKQLKINVAPEVSSGVYSNMAIISHSASEFVVDFAQVAPGMEGAVVRSRVYLAPIHARRLLNALVDNVRKYEQQFGTIVEPTPREGERGGEIPFFDEVGKLGPMGEA